MCIFIEQNKPQFGEVVPVVSFLKSIHKACKTLFKLF